MITIQPTNIPASQYVDGSSRYINSNVIYYNTNIEKYITFETYKKVAIPVSPNDIFTVLNKKYEYRPDLLANDVYQDPRLWWKILQANNIMDIYNFKAGLNIRIPALVF
jgi:hypothetical protein